MKRKIILFFLITNVALVFAIDIDEARELLMAERGGDILYLSRINFGIPGGGNWIAIRSDVWVRIYVINDEKEVRAVDSIGIAELSDVQYRDLNTLSYVDLEYNIMQGIPGTQLGDRAAKFGDYNGDGIDEIFVINPYNEAHCYMSKYDNDKGKMVFPFRCSYNLIGPREPAPILFTSYQGKDGILVHTSTFPDIQYVWVFFAWNEKSLKYEELVEFWADEIDYLAFPAVRKKEINQNKEEPVAEQNVLATPLKDSNETPPAEEITIPLYWFVTGGLILCVAVATMAVLMTRKKKRSRDV